MGRVDLVLSANCESRGLIGVTGTRVARPTPSRVYWSSTSATGQLVWKSFVIEGRLEATQLDDTTLLVFRQSWSGRRSQIENCCDSSGSTCNQAWNVGSAVMDVGNGEVSQFWVQCSLLPGGKWWTFVGQTWKEPKRELYEIVFPSVKAQP